MGTWFLSTLAVLALVAGLGLAGRWVLRRVSPPSPAVRQVGQWRVATDAQVRAVEVLGRVHLVYERGRESTVLDSRDADAFAAALEEHAPVPPRPARSLRGLLAHP